MRDLIDLLADAPGRELLAARGMHTDLPTFAAELSPPADDGLTALLGLPADTLLVHIGHQVCADYDPAVAAKFEAAAPLAALGVTSVALWHDLDRAESDRFGMRVVLPSGKGTKGVWLAPRGLGGREARFIPVERDRLEGLFADLTTWAENAQPKRRDDARARVAALADAVLSRDVETLGQANRALADHLLRACLDLELPAAFLSELLREGLFDAPMNAYLAALDEVVIVFNETVASLLAEEVDPRLRPLGDDYLPLFFSCPSCDVRQRLVHARKGADHWAVATCRCGAEHRFHLGARTISLGELAATGRWSPDVSLPVLHEHLASGWVVGRSTALYGMVFNEVVRRVFDQRPIPGLVPPGLLAAAESASSETLLLEYLTA